MILQKLSSLYDRLNQQGKVATSGYAVAKVDFCLVLDESGNIKAINDLRLDDKRRSSLSLEVPEPPKDRKGMKIVPSFLWDTVAYSLGLSEDDGRALEKHCSFRKYHENFLDKNNKGMFAFLKFLEQWEPELSRLSEFMANPPDIYGKNIVFRLDGEKCFLHEEAAAKSIWANMQVKDMDNIGQCLVTGQYLPIARTHTLLKIQGGQPAGSAILSFNKNSFTSFGKSQGANAPVSEHVAFAYTTVLNYLLCSEKSKHQRTEIGNAVTMFWAEAENADHAEEAEFFFSGLMKPTDDQENQTLSSLMQQIAKGRPLHELRPDLDPNTRFYILGLSPNDARISIRFWQQSTLGQLTEKIAQHYQDLYLEPIPWRTPPSIPKLTLETAPYRKDKKGEFKTDFKDVPPLLAGDLARAIFTGQRYPQSLLAQLLMRMRSDGHVTSLRVALCKAVINRAARLHQLSNQTPTPSEHHKEIPMSLDVTETNAAYRLGRLFAVLESIQRKALGDGINATIRDRYWGAASATPASIFPILIRNSANHLGKIRKENPSLSSFFDWQIGDIEQGLSTSWPKSLSMNDQGRFAIGYYHQKWTRTIKTKDGKEINNEMAESISDTDDDANNSDE